MQIAGLEKFSTVDYPGMLSAVVFTAGCNWNCWFCQNRDIIGGNITVDSADVMRFLRSRIGLLDAVVVSGGEPTIHADLSEFLGDLRDMGYRTKLDTNGSNPKTVRSILEAELTDYIAVDFKAPPDEYIESGCGAPERVRDTIEALREARVPFEVRTTVLPTFGTEALRCICRYMGEVPLYALQLYRPVPGDSTPMRPVSELEALRESLLDLQPNIMVRG